MDGNAGEVLVREILAGQTRTAFEAMRSLRPGLSERAFVATVDEQLRAGGYRLVGVFGARGGPAEAVAGFHLGQNLAWGRYLYVDDLSTAPAHRGRGHARALLRWIAEEGRALGVHELHLDSGVGRDRAGAHRLYLNAGYVITSHHFARPVAG